MVEILGLVFMGAGLIVGIIQLIITIPRNGKGKHRK